MISSAKGIIKQLVDAIVNPFEVYQHAEWAPPAYAGHLTTTMTTRILAVVSDKLSSATSLARPLVPSPILDVTCDLSVRVQAAYAVGGLQSWPRFPW